MKVPPNHNWLTLRDICATLGVARSTFQLMVSTGRFPRSCKMQGTKALWGYGVVADKVTTQLALWLGMPILTLPDYKPLGLPRPRGMSRREVEKLLQKTEAQTRKRSKPKAETFDEHEKGERAWRIARAYSEACLEAREAGAPLSVAARINLYTRLAKPDSEELRKFIWALRLGDGAMRKPSDVKAVYYSEPEVTEK